MSIRLLAALAGLVYAASSAIAAESYLITGAQVADGSGSPLRNAAVRIEGQRISEIGPLQPRPGEIVVHADGLVLAPGFIDTHNHSTETLDSDPLAESQISQGITTVLLGQDGNSPLPIAAYLAKRRAHPAALNVQILVGHATLRRKVMGDDFRRAARPAEIAAMAKLVDASMRGGASGLSTGLEYEVGSYSTTEEVISLARVAARHRGIYVSHLRDESDHAFDSFREIVRIGREAGLPVQISHIKLGTAGVWGRAGEAVSFIAAERAKGLDITADCYPYDAWSSTITVLVPDKRYDDPASVERGLADVGGAANVTITSCKAHPDYEFHTLDAIARQAGLTPVQLFTRIVQDGGAGAVVKAMKDDDIRVFYQAPWVMVGSDGGIGMRHPRGAGTYPRVLGVFVRERGWLTLPEAIRKMTSLPAWRLGLKDRGVIRPGMRADLVLFDPATVIDRSTFAEPTKRSAGIEKVWVNGQLVWNGNRATGALPGQVLRRQ
jgi:N-acyl-D-amino-acid deacylase